MKIYPIRLELLRTGEAENQLLSPLTPYLALCGDRPAEVVHVPFVHGEFLEMHGRLRYSHGPQAAAEAAAQMAQALHQFLSGIANLREEAASAQEAEVIELRLVLSAAELALLPFELIAAPGSLPSSKSLFSKPLILLRQSRRRAHKLDGWPDWPQILFASSQAGGVVPAQSHLVALQQAVQSFLPYPIDQYSDANGQRHWFRDHIEVLSGASLDAIRESCRKKRYTHVHILAHGGEDGPSWARRFGLQLHASDGQGTDLVHGGELANALQGPLGFPTVVTLASCDGGNQGNVLMPGGSLAQELHMAGVPLVAASQFPLTFQGSAAMASEFYRGVVRGRDPRQVMVETRTAMMTGSPPQALDWASLVVYTSPSDTFSQRVQVAHRRVEKRQIDAWIAQLGGGVDLGGAPARLFDSYEDLQAYRRALEKLQRDYLESSKSRSHRADAQRFFGSSEKRWAEAAAALLQKLTGELLPDGSGNARASDDFIKKMTEPGARARYRSEQIEAPLRRARDAYREAFSLAVNGGPVALVQSLALTTMLGLKQQGSAVEHSRWMLGLMPKRQRDAEWYRSMLELDLLAPATPKECCDQDQDCLLRDLFDEPDAAWEAYSLHRQLTRYGVLLALAMSHPDPPLRVASSDEREVSDGLAEIGERARALQHKLDQRGVRTTWEPTVMWGTTPGAPPTRSVR